MNDVPYAVTVPGMTFESTYDSITHFLGNYRDVFTVMDVSESDVSLLVYRTYFVRIVCVVC